VPPYLRGVIFFQEKNTPPNSTPSNNFNQSNLFHQFNNFNQSMSEPFKISVNGGQHTFEVTPQQAQQLNVVADGSERLHILLDGQAYVAEVLDVDYPTRTYTLRVDGQRLVVHISDHYERLVEQMGLSVGGTQKQNTVKAPMPGLVLSIAVEVGQSVAKGDPLLILEAMKMENVLKAVGDGVIKSIRVEQGATVQKGQLLLELE
jgi:biotin carboxyl carrier protein